jgi:hypothetical protein
VGTTASKTDAKSPGRSTTRAAAATPWGVADVVEEVSIPQRVSDRRFAVVFQLLEARSGDRLVRFAYSTDGVTRRGPVTMRARDLERLRAALERAPALREALGM